MRSILPGLTIVTLLMAAVTLVRFVYVAMHRVDEPQAAPALVWPEASVRYGAAEARWGVALFVDLKGVASRQAFTHVTRAIADGALDGGPGQLRLYHAPAGGCPQAAAAEFRCAAARAVECAENLSSGAGVELAGIAFELQWELPDRQDLAELLRRAARVGLDPDALARCVADDREVRARIGVHTAFAAERGLLKAPGGFLRSLTASGRLAPFTVGITGERLRALSKCLMDPRCGGPS